MKTHVSIVCGAFSTLSGLILTTAMLGGGCSLPVMLRRLSERGEELCFIQILLVHFMVHPWGANGFTAAHPGFLHDLLWFPDLLSLVPLHLVPLPEKPSGIIQVESAICVLSSSYQHIYSVCLEEILRLEWIKEWVSGFWRCRFIDLNPRGSLLQVWCGTQISA